MLSVNKEIQSEIILTTMEEIVPENSLFRKIDKYIDFTFIYEEVKELYQKRKEHVERDFADSKQNHGYRYAMYKGIEKNQNYTWLICAIQNMKNIAIKKTKVNKKESIVHQICESINKFHKNRIIFIKNLFIRKFLEKNLGVSLQSEKRSYLVSFFSNVLMSKLNMKDNKDNIRIPHITKDKLNT